MFWLESYIMTGIYLNSKYHTLIKIHYPFTQPWRTAFPIVKAFSLAYILFDLPKYVVDPPLNDDLPSEHLFTISLDNP